MEEDFENYTVATQEYSDDIDSSCSTPYASAPSSPGRSTPVAGFYFSAPASPTHFVISNANLNSYSSPASDINSSFEFDFSATFTPAGASTSEAMTSADELFCNGQIRPMKLSTHLQRPQFLAPLLESDDAVAPEEDHQSFSRGRELMLRAGSMRRRTRSMSPVRPSQRQNEGPPARTNTRKFEEGEDTESNETTPYASRSSSSGRSSRRWIFLKEFLYRSKSEGRNEGRNGKFWGSLYFSPAKDNNNKKTSSFSSNSSNVEEQSSARWVNKECKNGAVNNNNTKKINKRRGGVASPSAHEMHYTTNRAQAEEMRRKTFLPYRPGLLGCLGFSSRSYGAFNGFARTLNPVSSSG